MTDRYSTLRRGLVGAWCPSLQAGGTRLIDRSGYSTNPTLTGFSWSAVGAGAAISGNGTSALANIGDLQRFRITVGTITGWFKIAAQGAALRCIFASYSTVSGLAGISFGINIANNSQNALSLVIGNNAGSYAVYTTTLNVCDDALHSFALVVNLSVAQFYVDGAAISSSSSGSVSSAVYAATNYVGIGAEQTGSSTGKYWPGLLDDVRVYGRVLTLSEIKLLASRRGIGLVPTRHRRARLSTAAAGQHWINVGGVWKQATSYIRVGGVWKAATPKTRDAGAWKG